MALPPIKFSTFAEGNECQIGDLVVGLRSGANTKFKFPGTGFKDADGNFLLQYESEGSAAVNSLKIFNSLTSNPVRLEANGTDNNIDVQCSPKGAGSWLVPTPTVPFAAATKGYVDAITGGVEYFEGARVASTANFASTYDNGTAGVGATLTATANGAANIDGIALAVSDFVLFKDQTTTFQNGVYTLTTNGTAGTPSIFTRSIRFDTGAEIQIGNGVGVGSGTVNSSSVWIETEMVTTVGVDPILFSVSGTSTTGSSTDNAVVRFDGSSGTSLQNSGVIIGDGDEVSGVTQLDVDNIRVDGNTISSTDPNGNVDVSPNGTGGMTVKGGPVKIDAYLDEDNMASDSDTAFSTQQSIKKYVDDSIGINPIYRAKLNGSQSINPSTSTKVEFATEIFDTNSDYDTTLFRFTPTSARKYLITASIYFDDIGNGDAVTISIFKNGVEDSQKYIQSSAAATDLNPSVTAIIDMNGTTDFIEIFAFQNNGVAKNILDNANSFVCGHAIIE